MALYKNIKKIILKKITVIHNVFKKKNYKIKFLTNLILKKIKLTKKFLKKNITKKQKKIMQENTVEIYNVLWENLQL